MPRKVEFGAGVVVVPKSLIDATEREVDASKAVVFVVYPDDTKGSELDEIMRAAKQLADVSDGENAASGGDEPIGFQARKR